MSFSMDAFVRILQPERYELWKRGLDRAPVDHTQPTETAGKEQRSQRKDRTLRRAALGLRHLRHYQVAKLPRPLAMGGGTHFRAPVNKVPRRSLAARASTTQPRAPVRCSRKPDPVPPTCQGSFSTDVHSTVSSGHGCHAQELEVQEPSHQSLAKRRLSLGKARPASAPTYRKSLDGQHCPSQPEASASC